MNFSLKLRRSALTGGAAALLATASLGLAACGSSDDSTTGGSSGGSGGGSVAVVGYSTPETVYTDSLQPAFQKTPAGEGVDFSDSFGASGDQSRAVEAGQPADVVHFAQAGDMSRLVDAGKVDASWDKSKFDGIAQDSAVVIMVRKGNPEGIKSIDDVLSKDIDVITPNPFSSGSARWNIMAVYGSQIDEGKSEQEALDAVKTVLDKTVVQPGSARDALAAFTQGEGDVLLGYENEAIKAKDEGEDIDYVLPPSTIRIQTPIATTVDASDAATAFVDFIKSDEGQKIWAENGYRPANPKLVDEKQFPTPKDFFTIDKFGGWDKVNDEFFDEATGSVAKIEQELGVSTSG